MESLPGATSNTKNAPIFRGVLCDRAVGPAQLLYNSTTADFSSPPNAPNGQPYVQMQVFGITGSTNRYQKHSR